MIIVVCIAVFIVAFLLGIVSQRAEPRSQLRVEVGPSHESGSIQIQHTISARLMDRDGRCLHFQRIDMRDEDWEEQLAEATARMKQKARSLEAAKRIAQEVNHV
jgi:hypothetical protein